MRILLVSDVSIHAVIGGAERVLYEQAVGLQRRGHEVHILTRRLPEHATHEEVIEGVREWRYDIDGSGSLSFLISTLRECRLLFEHLQAEYAFDCINGHQPFSAWAVLRSPRMRGIPFVYTCHSLSFEEFLSRRRIPSGLAGRTLDALNASVRKRIEKKVLAAAARIVVLSGYTQNKLLTVHKTAAERIVIIPGGVDTGRFRPVNDRKSVRFRLGLPADRFMLLTVRNLVPRMGLENLIGAMRDVVRALPEIYLVIGGEGPLKASLLRRRDELHLQENILFTGFVPEADLPDCYRAADVFVLPTVELEGFGLVTLEALASGTPVLGTPVGGTLEILSRLDEKFLFADASQESISQSIIKTGRAYIRQPEQWQQDSRRCQEFAEKYYSWEANIDATERLFWGLISY